MFDIYTIYNQVNSLCNELTLQNERLSDYNGAIIQDPLSQQATVIPIKRTITIPDPLINHNILKLFADEVYLHTVDCVSLTEREVLACSLANKKYLLIKHNNQTDQIIKASLKMENLSLPLDLAVIFLNKYFQQQSTSSSITPNITVRPPLLSTVPSPLAANASASTSFLASSYLPAVSMPQISDNSQLASSSLASSSFSLMPQPSLQMHVGDKRSATDLGGNTQTKKLRVDTSSASPNSEIQILLHRINQLIIKHGEDAFGIINNTEITAQKYNGYELSHLDHQSSTRTREFFSKIIQSTTATTLTSYQLRTCSELERNCKIKGVVCGSDGKHIVHFSITTECINNAMSLKTAKILLTSALDNENQSEVKIYTKNMLTLNRDNVLTKDLIDQMSTLPFSEYRKAELLEISSHRYTNFKKLFL